MQVLRYDESEEVGFTLDLLDGVELLHAKLYGQTGVALIGRRAGGGARLLTLSVGHRVGVQV